MSQVAGWIIYCQGCDLSAVACAGACKAGLLWHPSTAGVTNLWISDVRDVRDKNAAAFEGLTADEAWDKCAPGDHNCMTKTRDLLLIRHNNTRWSLGAQ